MWAAALLVDVFHVNGNTLGILGIFVFRCPAVVVAELRHDTFPVVPVVVDVTAGCIVSISNLFCR